MNWKKSFTSSGLEPRSLQQKLVPENLSGGKARPASKADNLTAICEPTWDHWRLTTLQASTTYYKDSFTFHLYFLFTNN
jgi:hypothetical protein